MDFLREVILDIYDDENSYDEIDPLEEMPETQKFDEENAARTAFLLFEPILFSNSNYTLQWAPGTWNNLTRIFSNCLIDIVKRARKNLKELNKGTANSLDIFTGKEGAKYDDWAIEFLKNSEREIKDCGTQQFYNGHYVYNKCLYNSSFQFMLKHNMFPGIFYLNRLLGSTLQEYRTKLLSEIQGESIPEKKRDLLNTHDSIAIMNDEGSQYPSTEVFNPVFISLFGFNTYVHGSFRQEALVETIKQEAVKAAEAAEAAEAAKEDGLKELKERAADLRANAEALEKGVNIHEGLFCNLFGPVACRLNSGAHFTLISQKWIGPE